mgnify:FL=1
MLRRILAYHLAFIVLLTQVGIPVFTHYCRGKGETWVTAFREGKHCCAKKIRAVARCGDREDDSCRTSVKKPPCCENRAKLVKMRAEFMPVQVEWAPASALISIPALLPDQGLPALYPVVHDPAIFFRPHAPPLYRHGRSLLIFEQLFRC